MEIAISTGTIKLDSFLKFCGAAYSGANAKEMVNSGLVKVNGQTAAQRGKKLFPGDEIEAGGKIYKVVGE